ncbi:MAG: WD40 repeat domain-containing protein, partial [Candidatus Hodarchaeales archaeon]
QREVLSRTLSGHLYSIKRISISKNGKFIASGSFDGTVRIWDALNNYVQSEVLFFLPEMVEGLVLSNDSRFIIAGCEDSTIFYHDLVNDVTRQILPDEGANWRSGSLIVSPVANIIALIDYDDNLKVIDIEKGNNGEIIASITLTRDLGSNEAMRFSPDGQEIYLGLINGDIICINWKTGEEIGNLSAHEGSTLCLAINEAGMLVSGGMDQSVKLWKDGNLINVIPCESDPVSIEFYQDTVVAGTEREIVTFNINNDDSLVRIKHQISSSNVGITVDKNSIIRGMGENEIRIWSIAGKHLKTLLGRKETVNKAIISRDNHSIITASNDCAVHVVDLITSGEDIEILKGHDEATTALCISPDGAHLISSGFDDKLISWSTVNWQQDRVLSQAADMVTAMAFTPDGSRVVLACSGDNSIRLMDFASASILKTLYGHEDFMNELIIDPSTNLVYTASDDGSVRCWNFTDESSKTVLDNGDGVSMIAMSLAKGKKWLAAGGKSNRVQIIDITSFTA